MSEFSLEKYVGEWHELVHYESFFQKRSANNYNTTAKYKLLDDGTVDVLNTTYSKGEMITSHGVAHYLGKQNLRVDFDFIDIAKFMTEDSVIPIQVDKSIPNYVIKRIWLDSEDNYSFAVVTDTTTSSLWVLSRKQHPSKENYESVMSYVNKRFEQDKFVMTPHYTSSSSLLSD